MLNIKAEIKLMLPQLIMLFMYTIKKTKTGHRNG